MPELRIVDVTDSETFGRIPPCADPRFDHRTCDYWEDADRGRRDARASWLAPVVAPAPATVRGTGRPRIVDPFDPDGGAGRSDPAANPFLPAAPAGDDWNPFLAAPAPAADPFAAGSDDLFAVPAENPFAPPPPVTRGHTSGVPRKLVLLDRGRGITGPYGRILLADDDAVAWIQLGPLSAYPRAMRIRELYPALPVSPLPAVITCISTIAGARGRGYAQHLVGAVCDDLAERGFAAVEAYPDRTQPADATSAATPDFWVACGFHVAADDARFPVLRREL